MRIKVIDEAHFAFEHEGVCLLFPLFEDDLSRLSDWLDDASAGAFHALIEKKVLRGKEQEAYYLPTPLSAHSGAISLGLGKRAGFNAEKLRRSAGKAACLLSQHRIESIAIDAAHQPDIHPEAIVEAIMLAQYRFDSFKKAPEADAPLQVYVQDCAVIAPRVLTPDFQIVFEHTAQLAADVNWARDLANAPSNDLTPAELAERAKTMAKESGCACEILDEDRLRKLGMNALLAVARGSDKRANMIVLNYKHPDSARTIALVGKGITFDSGGISIKPGEGMHEMKFDMCGAAAVLGAMRAIARLKPCVNVVALVPTAENMPGAGAMTPGEIVRAYNGKTIEIHNTDAEGRLILADALAYAVDKYKPEAIVDLATLTGAVIVALGHYATGVLSNSDELCASLDCAAQESGERIWRLPLWDDYSKLIEGTHADLCNIGPAREAGSIIGGAFLKEFVADTPWAHCDIAGTAWGGKHISYLDPKFASGYGVRLLTQWVMNEAR